MRTLFKVVFLVAPLLALPTEARAWGWGQSSGCDSCHPRSCGWCWGINPFNLPGGCLAGPWYQYWPYEAHFSAAAPVAGAYPFGCSYPYWPSAQAGGGYPAGMGLYSQTPDWIGGAQGYNGAGPTMQTPGYFAGH